ncbi:hypothetical protein HanRHA438_Chr16g0763581 [Helianthus annuus]|nr:hypothetical protein HanIR_Chr16g0816831 [Helianthus annuus]KAJ0836148.1 hypothetical protein HanRHA438_Chr16g0763581 [Helianthus annuus]
MVRTGTLIGLFRDKKRPTWCVKSEQKGSVKRGGFGFVSFGKVRKLKKRVACFLCRWSGLLNKGGRKKEDIGEEHGLTLWCWSSNRVTRMWPRRGR